MLPDDVLVPRLRAGDDAAFAFVLQAWSPSMLRVARRCVATDTAAAEVVQDTWLAMIEGLAGFEGRSSVKTWVFRILLNKARRLGGAESRTVPYSSLGPEDAGPTVDPSRFQGPDEPFPGHWRDLDRPVGWPDPEDAVLAGELRRRARAAMAELSERQRTVLALRDIEGYDAAEVCSILDITAANQRVLLHRARAHVRRCLESYWAEVRT